MSRSPHRVFRLCRSALAAFVIAPAWAQTSAPPAELPAAPRTPVTEFRITGNTLLTTAQLEAAVVRFKGDRTADELKQAALAVQQRYAEAGYGAVVAYVPPQPVQGGVVAIMVLEGKLSAVTVTGQQQFTEANIRASLPGLQTGATPRLDLIDSQIQMANENPAKQVQVLLQPGQAPGDVAAAVTVAEEPVQRFSVALDNRGNSRTGHLRGTLGWQHANVAGLDHVFSAQLQTAPDKPKAVKVASAGYHVPLYAQRIALDAYAAYSDVSPGDTATLAGALQFNGRGRLFGIRATRYLLRAGEFDQRLSLALDQRDYINNCRIAGLPPGACGGAGESVSVQPLSVEYSAQRGGASPLGGALSLHHNLQIGGGHANDANFEAVRPGAKPHFTVLRFNAFGGVALSESLLLNARLAGQFTSQALVPGEQFGIGGTASVRGYEERELAGDRGVFVSVELSSTDLAKAAGLPAGDLRVLAFADGGWVGNRLGTPCLNNRDDCSLASLGVGARFSLKRWQAQLYVAQALKTAASTDRSDVRLHAALSTSF
jgi:hemolysin activation/secretion protein